MYTHTVTNHLFNTPSTLPSPIESTTLTRTDSIRSLAHDNCLNESLQNFSNHLIYAVKQAYEDLGKRALLRTNRLDIVQKVMHGQLDVSQCISIFEIREEINEALDKLEQENSYCSVEQMQSDCAIAIKKIYDKLSDEKHAPLEAYCNEHTYLLLDSLLSYGIEARCLRVMSLDGRECGDDMIADEIDTLDHSFLLYNSMGFENTAEVASVLQAVYASPHNTLILDPWGQDKIMTFSKEASSKDFDQALEKIMLNISSIIDTQSLRLKVCQHLKLAHDIGT